MNNILNKILCHHKTDEQAHCIQLNILSKKICICSRCVGLYPFAILWLILSLKYNIRLSCKLEKYLVLYLLLPAFLDWTLTGLSIIKSSNRIRFFTGFIASFGLSRWWFLFIGKYYLDVVWRMLFIYSIAIIVIFFFIYKQRSLYYKANRRYRC